MTLLLILLFFLLMLLGSPLFTIFSGLALYLLFSGQIDSSAMIIEMHRMATTPILVAIPLFTFAGYVLAESGAPKRVIRLSNALIGWLPGGLSVITLVTCAVFTALTGATGLTIIAMGGILYPALLRGRYPEMFSLGLVTNSGTLGLLFPPSLPIIIYAIVSNVQIHQLFLAGLLPGVLRPNKTLSFICRQVTLVVDDADTPWTGGLPAGTTRSIPIKNHDGAWYGDPAEGRVVFRYDETNPTGAFERVAGIANLDGNVLGMMPHPECACDPLVGSVDGRVLFDSLVAATSLSAA